jgi:hypothetical protein
VEMTPNPFSGKSSSGAWLRDLTDAIRFREPRRMVYNLVFVLFAAIWLLVTWPHFRPAFTQPSFLWFGVLVRRPGFVGQCLLFCRLPRRHPKFSAHLSGPFGASAAGCCGCSAHSWRLFWRTIWIADEIYPFVR